METSVYYEKRQAEKRRALKLEVKNELKGIASTIRQLKAKRKKVPFGYVPELESEQWEFRRKHIAYCIFFNRKEYFEIEQPAPDNFVDEYYYKGFIKEWEREV